MKSLWAFPLILAAFILPVMVEAADVGTNDDFAEVNRAVVRLLLSHDARRFAAEMSPSIQDWQSILSPNATNRSADPLAPYRKSVKAQRKMVQELAGEFLAKADLLRVDFSKGSLRAQATPPALRGNTQYDDLMGRNATLPWLDKLQITLSLDSGSNGPVHGDFKLDLASLVKFPGGWRSLGGIQWLAFPTNMVDAKTVRETMLLARAANGESITDKDDPALLKLGEALIHFIRTRDPGVFKSEAYVTADLLWSLAQANGCKGPSRREVDDIFKDEAEDQVTMANTVVQEMNDVGIDLKDADIQIIGAMTDSLEALHSAGTVVGLTGNQFKLAFKVKTGATAKNGAALSGEYVLAAKEIMRFADDWKVSDYVYWFQVPETILDKPAAERMAFEGYVGQYGTLPPGTSAPQIEFTTLAGAKKMTLADFLGKVVVLDFWATWCGACQKPMADLQTLRQIHPEWRDRVAIVPLSIDDTLKIARKYVNKKGWTNTFNVWAGDGGWQSKPAKAFRVRGVPTTYVIDTKGQIVQASDIIETVENLLQNEK